MSPNQGLCVALKMRTIRSPDLPPPDDLASLHTVFVLHYPRYLHCRWR
ncbi:hypothetical protein ALO54_101382 [Pseudomonas syringae pv. philadelphi]|uniref:Uncharacterized protein n=1 Tax=Pseudomonas syringae pv. spinaceae TaxID=264459 RepID=A0A0Q0BB29_PSESX|nr:hypothetical protein ALO87_101484 [Pseudomonas syringae pv. apii]KPW51373.1 hypothetical protein ALO86_101234 [Pseudomonas syringae pv. berberidis]KPX70003.1 hypothetical protein ALO84_101300 [Pseudomonas syringae pv. maculicola]KPY14093.1 hypothetical protein ALO54_101382 [Pseudomonas syringae pv. philadelphi]KPY88885.1 hypothetical protein ALO94_100439 [Pseudomonas syringae pv. spinaceae]